MSNTTHQEDLEGNVFAGMGKDGTDQQGIEPKNLKAGDLIGQYILLRGFEHDEGGKYPAVVIDFQSSVDREEKTMWTSSKVLIEQLEYLKNNLKFPVTVRVTKVNDYYKFK